MSGTFINSARPDYNNGGASSLYLGEDFYGGFMRCLIRFDLPPSFTERTSISGATLSLTTGAPTGGNPAAATVYVQRLIESWGQGTGAGPDPITGDYTYGQLCSVGGAMWNQPFCSGVTWSTIGAGADATLSGSASSPATPASVVQWNAAGMASDVQSWVDTPSSNHGWRLRSSSEGTLGAVQRFFNPQLSISYGCKNGFEEIAGSCTTCTAAAESACVTSQADNDCNDSGPPSTTYSCTCNNPAYVGGPGGTKPASTGTNASRTTAPTTATPQRSVPTTPLPAPATAASAAPGSSSAAEPAPSPSTTKSSRMASRRRALKVNGVRVPFCKLVSLHT